jgi:hypothetical protein
MTYSSFTLSYVKFIDIKDYCTNEIGQILAILTSAFGKSYLQQSLDNCATNSKMSSMRSRSTLAC